MCKIASVDTLATRVLRLVPWLHDPSSALFSRVLGILFPTCLLICVAIKLEYCKARQIH
jgi:hypothetical protein